MSTRRLLAGRAARTAVRTGALRFAPRVTADPSTLFEDPNRSVIAAAATALGTPVAHCAITLGPRRYNRKPVVQLMDRNAHTIGFLKVGADAATSRMVATEAAAIARLSSDANPVLEVPQVQWSGEWHDRSVACLSPLGQNDAPLVAPDDERLAAVAAAVIDAHGDRHMSTVHESAPVHRLRAAADDAQDDRVRNLLDRVSQARGDAPVTLASWHGDFSPWNMISTAATTSLIDWEFAGDGMPIGADLLHHRVMVATHLDAEPGTAPLDRFVATADRIPELDALGVDRGDHRTHLLLYLLELIRRDLVLAADGLSTTGLQSAAHEAARRLLDEAVS